MKIFALSRLSKWMIWTGLGLLLFMTIMRVAFYYRFHSTVSGTENYINPFLLGLRYDLRIICGIVLFPFLIGQLYLTRKNGKLSAGSIFRISITVISMVALLLFMKKGHMQPESLTMMTILFLLILSWLLLSKDCNPFHKKISEKIFRWFFNIIFFVLVLFYALDFEHYDYLQQRLSASIINFTGDAKISLNMIWETYPVFGLTLFILLSTALLVWWVNFSFKKISGQSVISGGKSYLSSIILALLFALAIFGRLNQYPLRWSDAFAYENDFKANLALNPIQSFLSTLQFRNSGYDIHLVKKYYPLISKYLRIPDEEAKDLNFRRQYKAPDTAVKRNVIIVICESFSAYKSTMYGNPLNATPYFNEMCKEGVFYDRCFTPSYGTARGVWATITGIPDVEYPNTSSRNPSYVDQHSIINDYHGYEKYYFIGGSSSWANIRGLLTNNLTDLRLLEEEDFKAQKVDVWGISDKRLFLAANNTFKNLNKPFVAVIQTADNHRPYTIPVEDKKNFELVNYPKDTLLKYGFSGNDDLNAFRYTDYAFRTFIEAAKKESYFKNTLFVFVGDHGVHGYSGAEFPKVWESAGLNIHHVPLLFYAPDFLKPERLHNACSQLDVLPSATAIAGVSYMNTTMGINLFDSTSTYLPFRNSAFLFDPTIRQIGIITDSLVYTKNQIGNREDLYSLIQGITPNPSKKGELRTLTDAWYQTAKYLLQNNRKITTGKK